MLSADARATYERFSRAWWQVTGTAPTEEGLAGFSAGWALFHDVLPGAGPLTAASIAATARALDLPRGSLPNGAGLHFSVRCSHARPEHAGRGGDLAVAGRAPQRHGVAAGGRHRQPRADPTAGVIGARAAGRDRAPALVAAVGCAALGRALLGGTAPAGSVPGAVLFLVTLAAVVVLAGIELTPVPWGGVAAGLVAGAALVALSLVGVTVMVGPRAPAATLAWWVPLVSLVAALEELVFRGVLFEMVRDRSGATVALAVTTVLFALIHVPLYGIGALPIDVCVGVFLGCLRIATKGVTAPLVAHVVADLATGWVG